MLEGKEVVFARGVGLEQKTKLANEVERLIALHDEDASAIMNDLQPVADRMGVQLASLSEETVNYYRRADGTFEVRKEIAGKEVTFATGIVSEDKAERLSAELERLVHVHGADVPRIRSDLENTSG